MHIHLFMKRPSPLTHLGMPQLPCACATLRRASRVVTSLYDEALRQSGLRIGQFTLLQVLWEAGPQQHGQLGHLIGMDSTTLSRTIRIMEDQGWVRPEHGEDRRERYWNLTSKGRHLLEKARAPWEHAQRRLLGRLGPDAWSRLSADLELLTASALPE